MDVYQRLARHLDRLPAGYPTTGTGVEIRILRRLFTPEEAEIALHLSILPEKARVIAYRAGISIARAERTLSDMAGKGCIMSVTAGDFIDYVFPDIPFVKTRIKKRFQGRNGNDMMYMAYQFVIGIWEFHLNDLDPDFIGDMNSYMPYLIENWKDSPQLRTIPVHRSIRPDLKIFSYETAGEIIAAQEKIAVAPCICRKEMGIMGKACKSPLETCLVFGLGADYYVRNGLGRFIDSQEALEILEIAQKAGLVLQPSNSKEVMNICCCCGCCCGVLRNMKAFPEPGKIVPSPFQVGLDAEACKSCGICEKKCPMEAVSMTDKRVTIHTERCIGCGVCVSFCPENALALVRKPKKRQPRIVGSTLKFSYDAARKRGKMSPLIMAQMAGRSILDHILAPRQG